MTTSGASLGLINLQEEPQRYTYEAECISNDLDTLVLENYKIFIENMTCSVRLQNEDDVLAASLNSLKGELNTLSSVTIRDLRKSLNEFLTSYSRNKKTLQQHMKLIEFLEVPQLIDACVRNEFYDEALDLSSFVFGLVQRSILIKESSATSTATVGVGDSAAPVPVAGGTVLLNIVDEIISLLQTLRAHLIGSLLAEQSQAQSTVSVSASEASGASAPSAAISLPKQIEIVSIVKKIDALLLDRQVFLAQHSGSGQGQEVDKAQLQAASRTHLLMEYLQARGVWLQRRSTSAAGQQQQRQEAGQGQTIVQGGTGMSSYGMITELIDTTRTCLYSIIIEYRALFDDELQVEVLGRGRQPTARLVLHAWVMQQVQQVLARLESYLLARDHPSAPVAGPGPGLNRAGPGPGDGASLDGTSYRALFEQCLFLNLRLKSVGFNVHDLICQTFSQCVFARLSRQWGVALVQFKSMIATERVQIEDSGEDSEGSGSSGKGQMKEQVAPLYWDQKQRRGPGSGTDAEAEAGTGTGTGSGEVRLVSSGSTIPPLTRVTNFPPLAFMLNSLLGGFNFIKECNMAGLRELLLAELSAVCSNVCAAVCSIAKDLRLRGNKYLSNLPANAGPGLSGEDGDGQLQMDRLYSRIFAAEFVPYVLYCFEQLYYIPLEGGRGAAKEKTLLLPMTDLNALYDSSAGAGDPVSHSASVLSPEAIAIVTDCWTILSKAQMI